MAAEFCDACRHINIERLSTPFVLLPRVGLFDPEKYPHSTGLLPTTSRTAVPSCQFCDKFWFYPKTAPFLAEILNVKNGQNSSYRSRLRLDYAPGYTGNRQMGPPFDFDFFTDEGDPAQEFGVRAKKDVTSTSSAGTASWAKTKLHECRSTHPNCQGKQIHISDNFLKPKTPTTLDQDRDEVPSKGSVCYPRRLLDLNSSNGLDCVLSDASDISRPVYATLSYCWGADVKTDYKTTTANVSAYQEFLPYAQLPMTIRNAIDFTRQLGIQYLWVDALCILQDHEDDWDEESAQMHTIYRNAEIAISADSSTSVDGGMFNNSSVALDLKCSKIENQLSDGRKSCLYFCRMASEAGDESLDSAPQDEPLTRSPLASRAWALQERRLSKRIVHFHEKQAIWECAELISSEDNAWEARMETQARAKGHAPCILLSSLQDPSVIPHLWYGSIDGLLFKFLECNLTVQNDKLPAIAGVAATIAEYTNSPYVAGLWFDHDLPRGLAWQRRLGPGRTWTHRPGRAPSFSWASWDGPLRWEAGSTPIAFSADSYSVVLRGKNPFGRVDKCSLSLTGHISSASMRLSQSPSMPNAGQLYFGDREDGFVIVDDIDSIEREEVYIFPLFGKGFGCSALVLEKADARSNEYRRLGLATLRQESGEACWEWPVRSIVLI